MENLTKKEFIQIIDDLNLNQEEKYQVYKICKIPEYFYDLEGYNLNEPLFEPTLKKISVAFEMMEVLKEKFAVFLKYEAWRNDFLSTIKEVAPSSLITELLLPFYNILKNSDILSIHNPEYKDFLIEVIQSRTIYSILDAKEYAPIIKIMEDIFNNKDELGINFFKEVFAIYIENSRIYSVHKDTIDKMKNWALDQDFTHLYPKYRNIRELFEASEDEQELITFVKKVDLSTLAKQKTIPLSIFKKNIEVLHSFITNKLKMNTNFHNISTLDQRSIFKVMLTYKERDELINSIIDMQDDFIKNMPRKSVEFSEIEPLWLTYSLKNELDINLDKRKRTKI